MTRASASGRTTKFVVALILTFPLVGAAHWGGLDKRGGHTNRQTGEYHCHKESCFSQFKQSEQALEEAQSQGRDFSRVYDRTEWEHWVDDDRDCQDLRAELLIAQSLSRVEFSDWRSCYVARGRWVGAFSGETFRHASQVHIDHVVPLYWAHKYGGAEWSPARKRQFANDPENLLIVERSLNETKKAKGPSAWVPPVMAKCAYVMHFAKVVRKYQLSPPAADARVIASCENQ